MSSYCFTASQVLQFCRSLYDKFNCCCMMQDIPAGSASKVSSVVMRHSHQPADNRDRIKHWIREQGSECSSVNCLSAVIMTFLYSSFCSDHCHTLESCTGNAISASNWPRTFSASEAHASKVDPQTVPVITVTFSAFLPGFYHLMHLHSVILDVTVFCHLVSQYSVVHFIIRINVKSISNLRCGLLPCS